MPDCVVGATNVCVFACSALLVTELVDAVDHPEYQFYELDEWIERVLLYYGWDLAGLIVGFNLKFDLSRA